MNFFSLTLCFLAVLGSQTSAQISEIWEAQTDYNSALFDAGLRLTPSGLIAVNFEQLMEGRQKAWAVSTDGVSQWSYDHTQFGNCTNCDEARVTGAVVTSNGTCFQVGTQWTSPFSGKYLNKINPDGSAGFSQVTFGNSGSAGFIDCALNSNESALLVSGGEFSDITGLLSPHMYRFDLDGNLQLKKDIGIYNYTLSSFLVDDAENIYFNASGIDSLRLVSLNASFEENWRMNIAALGFQFAGPSYRVGRFANGDILFVSYGKDYNTFIEANLHLLRITTEGNLVWHSIKDVNWVDNYSYLVQDIHVDANDNVYVYMERVLESSSGGIALQTSGENNQRYADITSVDQVRPVLYKFSSTGAYQWNYLNNGSSSETDNDFWYCGEVISDENGNLILSSGSDFSGFHYSILTSQGQSATQLHKADYFNCHAIELLYNGNQEFFALGAASVSDSSRWIMNKFSYELPPLGIENKTSVLLDAYPNPSNGICSLRWKDKTSDVISIYNAQGRLIRREKAPSSSGLSQLDLSDQTSGIYFIKVGAETLRLLLIEE